MTSGIIQALALGLKIFHAQCVLQQQGVYNVGTFSFSPATHSGLSNKHVTSMKELLIFQVEW